VPILGADVEVEGSDLGVVLVEDLGAEFHATLFAERELFILVARSVKMVKASVMHQRFQVCSEPGRFLFWPTTKLGK